MCSHIGKHLDDHNISSTFQHGFRKGHCCDTQLILTIDDLLMSYHDKNTQVDVAILGFSKAFDVVPQKRLLATQALYDSWEHPQLDLFIPYGTQTMCYGGQ